ILHGHAHRVDQPVAASAFERVAARAYSLRAVHLVYDVAALAEGERDHVYHRLVPPVGLLRELHAAHVYVYERGDDRAARAVAADERSHPQPHVARGERRGERADELL